VLDPAPVLHGLLLTDRQGPTEQIRLDVEGDAGARRLHVGVVRHRPAHAVDDHGRTRVAGPADDLALLHVLPRAEDVPARRGIHGRERERAAEVIEAEADAIAEIELDAECVRACLRTVTDASSTAVSRRRDGTGDRVRVADVGRLVDPAVDEIRAIELVRDPVAPDLPRRLRRVDGTVEERAEDEAHRRSRWCPMIASS
jgi:hypothetical protein